MSLAQYSNRELLAVLKTAASIQQAADRLGSSDAGLRYRCQTPTLKAALRALGKRGRAGLRGRPFPNRSSLRDRLAELL